MHYKFDLSKFCGKLCGFALGRGFKLKKAFTITEILIALTVVAVIAVLLIPVITTRAQNKTFALSYESEVKQMLNSLEGLPLNENRDNITQTMMYVENDNGNYVNNAGAYINKYMKVTRYCGNTPGDCFASEYYRYQGNDRIPFDMSVIKGACAQLKNGVSICLKPQIKGQNDNSVPKEIEGWIDINGLKGPNIYGRDLRTFSINLKQRAIFSDETPELVILPDPPATCEGNNCNEPIIDPCESSPKSEACCTKEGYEVTGNYENDACCYFYKNTTGSNHDKCYPQPVNCDPVSDPNCSYTGCANHEITSADDKCCQYLKDRQIEIAACCTPQDTTSLCCSLEQNSKTEGCCKRRVQEGTQLSAGDACCQYESIRESVSACKTVCERDYNSEECCKTDSRKNEINRPTDSCCQFSYINGIGNEQAANASYSDYCCRLPKNNSRLCCQWKSQSGNLNYFASYNSNNGTEDGLDACCHDKNYGIESGSSEILTRCCHTGAALSDLSEKTKCCSAFQNRNWLDWDNKPVPESYKLSCCQADDSFCDCATRSKLSSDKWNLNECCFDSAMLSAHKNDSVWKSACCSKSGASSALQGEYGSTCCSPSTNNDQGTLYGGGTNLSVCCNKYTFGSACCGASGKTFAGTEEPACCNPSDATPSQICCSTFSARDWKNWNYDPLAGDDSGNNDLSESYKSYCCEQYDICADCAVRSTLSSNKWNLNACCFDPTMMSAHKNDSAWKSACCSKSGATSALQGEYGSTCCSPSTNNDQGTLYGGGTNLSICCSKYTFGGACCGESGKTHDGKSEPNCCNPSDSAPSKDCCTKFSGRSWKDWNNKKLSENYKLYCCTEHNICSDCETQYKAGSIPTTCCEPLKNDHYNDKGLWANTCCSQYVDNQFEGYAAACCKGTNNGEIYGSTTLKAPVCCGGNIANEYCCNAGYDAQCTCANANGKLANSSYATRCCTGTTPTDENNNYCCVTGKNEAQCTCTQLCSANKALSKACCLSFGEELKNTQQCFINSCCSEGGALYNDNENFKKYCCNGLTGKTNGNIADSRCCDVNTTGNASCCSGVNIWTGTKCCGNENGKDYSGGKNEEKCCIYSPAKANDICCNYASSHGWPNDNGAFQQACCGVNDKYCTCAVRSTLSSDKWNLNECCFDPTMMSAHKNDSAWKSACCSKSGASSALNSQYSSTCCSPSTNNDQGTLYGGGTNLSVCCNKYTFGSACCGESGKTHDGSFNTNCCNPSDSKPSEQCCRMFNDRSWKDWNNNDMSEAYQIACCKDYEICSANCEIKYKSGKMPTDCCETLRSVHSNDKDKGGLWAYHCCSQYVNDSFEGYFDACCWPDFSGRVHITQEISEDDLKYSESCCYVQRGASDFCCNKEKVWLNTKCCGDENGKDFKGSSNIRCCDYSPKKANDTCCAFASRNGWPNDNGAFKQACCEKDNKYCNCTQLCELNEQLSSECCLSLGEDSKNTDQCYINSCCSSGGALYNDDANFKKYCCNGATGKTNNGSTDARCCEVAYQSGNVPAACCETLRSAHGNDKNLWAYSCCSQYVTNQFSGFYSVCCLPEHNGNIYASQGSSITQSPNCCDLNANVNDYCCSKTSNWLGSHCCGSENGKDFKGISNQKCCDYNPSKVNNTCCAFASRNGWPNDNGAFQQACCGMNDKYCTCQMKADVLHLSPSELGDCCTYASDALTDDNWLNSCCSIDNLNSAPGGQPSYGDEVDINSYFSKCCEKLYKTSGKDELFYAGSPCCRATGNGHTECIDECDVNSGHLRTNPIYYDEIAIDCCENGKIADGDSENWANYCCGLLSSNSSNSFKYSSERYGSLCCPKRYVGSSSDKVYYYVPSYINQTCPAGGEYGKCSSYYYPQAGFYCGEENDCLAWAYQNAILQNYSCCQNETLFNRKPSDCCNVWLKEGQNVPLSGSQQNYCCSLYESSPSSAQYYYQYCKDPCVAFFEGNSTSLDNSQKLACCRDNYVYRGSYSNYQAICCALSDFYSDHSCQYTPNNVDQYCYSSCGIVINPDCNWTDEECRKKHSNDNRWKATQDHCGCTQSGNSEDSDSEDTEDSDDTCSTGCQGSHISSTGGRVILTGEYKCYGEGSYNYEFPCKKSGQKNCFCIPSFDN